VIVTLARFLRQEAVRAEEARRVNPGPMLNAADLLEAIDEALQQYRDCNLPGVWLAMKLDDLLHPEVTS
jgi:hypothetical protein